MPEFLGLLIVPLCVFIFGKLSVNVSSLVVSFGVFWFNADDMAEVLYSSPYSPILMYCMTLLL